MSQIRSSCKLAWAAPFLLLSTWFVSGCASVGLINLARTGEIGIINPLGVIIGLGIMWYCWTEAKRKNRNPWVWLLLGFLFGLIPFAVLVYLKDLPANQSVPPTHE